MKSVPEARQQTRSATIAPTMGLIVLGSVLFLMTTWAAPVPTGKPGTYPSWWFSRNVIAQKSPTNSTPGWPTNYPTSDDYALVNQGQLKNMATQAYNELQAQTPASAWFSTPQGMALSSMITSWDPAYGDNYALMNLGQLKTVAKPFYDLLTQIGYTNAYPWSGVGADDYVIANLGQLKNVFKFDVGVDTDSNGLPDWWETHYFGHLGNVGSSPSAAGDGYTLAQEYTMGRNPNDYYQGIAPVITIVGGGNQYGTPSTMLTTPLSFYVSAGSNSPVTIAVTPGTALLATSPTGATSTSLSLRTSPGNQLIYLKTGTTVSDFSTITITPTGYPGAAVTTTVGCYDSTIPPPTGLTAAPAGQTSVTLTWTNHSSNGAVIRKSTDHGATWQIIGTVGSSVSTYTATGLAMNQSTEFEVLAKSPSGGGGGTGSTDGGSSAPPSPTTVTASGIPTLLEETHSAYLPKYGGIGFTSATNAVPNYYLKRVWFTSGHSDLGSGTTTTTLTNSPLTGGGTYVNSSTGVDWGKGDGGTGPIIVASDTVETQHYANSFSPHNVDDTTITLSNPNTTTMLKANALDPTILQPFTNGFIISPPGNPPLAYINLATDQSYITLTDLQYKFKVDASTNTTVYWDDQFVPADGSPLIDTLQHWSGSTGTETESSVSQITGTTLESGPNGVHYILPIYLLRDNQLVTGANNAVAVGQQINLSIALPPSGTTAYQWSIPGVDAGTAFKDYQPTDSEGNNNLNPYTSLQPSDLTNQSVSFYWSDGGTKNLSCILTVNGHNLVIPISFNVERPTNATITATHGVIAADSNYKDATADYPFWLHFGTSLALNTSGMLFNESITPPPNFTGDWCWVQLLTGDLIKSTYDTGYVITTVYPAGLDTEFPYNDTPEATEADDSPGTSLLQHQLTGYRDFGATMYLMWKPILPAGSSDARHDSTVWVPLRAVNWHWNGTATYNSTNLDWNLSSATYPPNIHDFDVTTEPNWSQIIIHQSQ